MDCQETKTPYTPPHPHKKNTQNKHLKERKSAHTQHIIQTKTHNTTNIKTARRDALHGLRFVHNMNPLSVHVFYVGYVLYGLLQRRLRWTPNLQQQAGSVANCVFRIKSPRVGLPNAFQILLHWSSKCLKNEAFQAVWAPLSGILDPAGSAKRHRLSNATKSEVPRHPAGNHLGAQWVICGAQGPQQRHKIATQL